MTPDQKNEAELLWRRGYTPLSIARCLTGVSYREIEAAFDFSHQKHPENFGFTAGFAKWLMEECPYTWRANNPNPADAPWRTAPGLKEYEQG